jgi:hypothetical protein
VGSMNRKLKAFFIAVLSLRHRVTFTRRGKALIAGLTRRVAFIFRPFYDVRMTRSGAFYFQLRDRRAEKKRLKRFRNLIIRKGELHSPLN